MVVALTTLVFAPVAVAQDDNPSADDRGADDRGMDDRGFDDNGGAPTFDDNPSANDRGFNDRGFDDNPTGADDVMASPTASASAATGAASTASATATATATATLGKGGDDATASVGQALPRTGGRSPVALASAAALVLLVGSRLVATRLMRRGR